MKFKKTTNRMGQPAGAERNSGQLVMMFQQSIDAGAFELSTVHEAGAFDCSMQLSDFLRDVPKQALSTSDNTIQELITLHFRDLRVGAPSLPFPPPSRFQRDTRSRST